MATAKSSDGLTQLANQTLPAITNSEQLSGARINTILSNPQVNWNLDTRNIDDGQTTLQADVISNGSNALQYIQKITEGEPGSFFIAKNGNARFKDRYGSSSSGSITFSDNGTGLPYTNLRVVYGTELLYNEIVSSRLGGGTALANNDNSQEQYGIFNLTLDGLLMDDDTTNQNLVNLLISKYANPEYRFGTRHAFHSRPRHNSRFRAWRRSKSSVYAFWSCPSHRPLCRDYSHRATGRAVATRRKLWSWVSRSKLLAVVRPIIW